MALVLLHILALHDVGSNNPDGIEIDKDKDENGVPVDGVAFWPYHVVKDLVAIGIFLTVFCLVIFFFPEGGGYFIEKPNYEPANSLKTPEHIAPVWYFTPYYSMLRAITFSLFGLDAKFLGVVTMGGAIAILFVVPWLDRSPVKSMRYKGWMSRTALAVFVVSFIVLGYLGTIATTEGRTQAAQLFTLLYFLYFILMPFYTRIEATKPVPSRVVES
jgi:ubiquinol-cytochrome c reductase cytochrome b subunit